MKALVTLLLAFAAGCATAQSTPPANPFADALKASFANDTKAALENFQNYRVDLAVPTSPAFAVLGATPATVLQPHTPRDLAVSLVQALTDEEKLGNGVGLDIAPYMLFAGRSLTLGEYQQSKSLQRLANLQVSFAAIKAGTGTGTGKVTRGALGLSLPLIDEADPRLARSGLGECFSKAVAGSGPTPAELKATLDAQAAGDGPAAKAALKASADRVSVAWDACRDAHRQRAWSGTRWLAGLARAYDNRDGGASGRTANLWTTYTLDMTRKAASAEADTATTRSQVLLHLRRTVAEEIASDTDPRGFTLRSGTLLAGGYRYGSERRNLTLELSVNRARYDTGISETSRKLALGGELKVSQDLWLVLTVGGEGGRKNGKNQPFALAGIKFGAAGESTGAFGPR